MEQTIDRVFTEFSARKLEQLLSRIETCTAKLTDDQIWMRGVESQNAVGNLMLHLSGNVRQWILSGVGGKPDVRVRDREFAARGDISREDLWERLSSTVKEAVSLIEGLPAARLLEQVKIQNYEVTVLEAVYHVVEHFAQHTAQIIFATKALTGEDMGFYKHLTKAAHAEQTP